jgi:hypothetical protein
MARWGIRVAGSTLFLGLVVLAGTLFADPITYKKTLDHGKFGRLSQEKVHGLIVDGESFG